MCRAKSHGGNGRRCAINTTRSNARRRAQNAVRFSEKVLSELAESHGTEWYGDVEGIGLKLSSPLVAKSYALAAKYHAGVKRKSGEVYLNHPLRVAQSLQEAGYNEEVVSIALLHDTVEDTDLTLGQLRKLGYSERVISGVDSVTKRDGEDYTETIQRARRHPLGRVVKLADNFDNSSEEQLAPFNEEKRAKQRAKYRPAREILIYEIRMKPSADFIRELEQYRQGYKVWDGSKESANFFAKIESGLAT